MSTLEQKPPEPIVTDEFLKAIGRMVITYMTNLNKNKKPNPDLNSSIYSTESQSPTSKSTHQHSSYSSVVAQPQLPSSSHQTHLTHNQPNPNIRQKTLYTTIESKNPGTFNKFNIFSLPEEIKRCLGKETSFTTCFIRKDQIIIKASSPIDYEKLQGHWPADAFESGINVIKKESKFYIALLNISHQELDVDNVEIKGKLLEIAHISAMQRIINRSDNSATNTVKAIVNNHEAYLKLMNEGKLVLGSRIVRVKPWNFRESTNQCFRCCGFNHSSNRCEKEAKCIRCAGSHLYKDCTIPISDTKNHKCANCLQNHAAVSKVCPKHTDQVKKKLAAQTTSNHPQPAKDGRYLRSNYLSNTQALQHHQNQVGSEGSCHGGDRLITGMLFFLVDTFKNFNTFIENLNSSEKSDDLKDHFGKFFKASITDSVIDYINGLHNETDETESIDTNRQTNQYSNEALDGEDV